ncbi:MAG: ATPase, T2SS/T4P/T4SS family, partial [Candidatus Brocadiales bacterium]
MDVKKLVEEMVRRDASDIYILVGAPPSYRINNKLETSEQYKKPLSSEQTKELAFSLLNERQREVFTEEHEMDIAHSYEGLGRIRINLFYQRNSIGVVMRHVGQQIKSFKELNLPPALAKISMEQSGLVLVVGGAGSGKSTALAAMVDYRSSNSEGHVITIEDPIEFLHSHKKCSLVTQREVGIDTNSYLEGLKHALRQAPDVILIGEIRDKETME